MSRSRYTAEERVGAATEYLLGRRSAKEIGKDLNVDPRTLRNWARLLSESGEAIFIEKKRNQRYSAALKRQAVEEYISRWWIHPFYLHKIWHPFKMYTQQLDKAV